MNLKDLSCVCFDQLYKEMEELKERNKTLQEIAGQAEYFASLYQVHAVIMQKSVLADEKYLKWTTLGSILKMQ